MKPKNNKIIIILIIFLLIIGSINTFGATFTSYVFSKLYIRQIIWSIISIVIYGLTYKMNRAFLYKYAFMFYFIGITALLLVLFWGSTINGATSWFKIGSLSIQPSEIFKPFYLIYLSIFVTSKRKLYYFKLLLITLIPCILIFIEPDSGVTFMYALMSIGVISVSEINKKRVKQILVIGGALLLIVVFLYVLKKDVVMKALPSSFSYRINRLLKTDSYQIENALIGIGSSKILGHGIKSNKVYIPEMVSDFAFALVIMNFGYIVGIIVVVIYVYLLWSIHIKMKYSEGIDKCYLNGLLLLMFFQCSEHIFMNLGVTPITGITLPFLSYGGSSMVSYAILFSMATKITTNNSSYN